MVFKKGDILWGFWIDYDEGSQLDEWHVTSIRNEKFTKKFAYDGQGGTGVTYVDVKKEVVHLTCKTPWTWVKKSTKHFDYGWASNIDSEYKKKFFAEDGIPKNLFRTKKAAYRSSIPDLKKTIGKLKRTLTRIEKKTR